MNKNILFSNEIIKNLITKIDKKKYGVKANNLLKIPKAHCPIYAILAEDSISQENIEKVFEYFKINDCNQLIVRSSSSEENIYSRGKYISITCENDITSIHKAIIKVIKYFKTHSNPNEKFGVIIQSFIFNSYRGHISNSTRVVKNRNQYLVDLESPILKSFLIENKNTIRREDPYDKKIHIVISKLFEFFSTFKLKFRFSAEWVFASGKLYIVQIDYTDTLKIKNLKRNIDCFTSFSSNYKYFFSLENVEISGNKLFSIQKNKILNLIPNDFLILGYNELTKAIYTDTLTKEQQKIIEDICLNKVIIRTDKINTGNNEENVLLPRSNIIYRSKNFINFIKNVYSEGNYPVNKIPEIYFLVHKFTFSNKSAIIDFDYHNNLLYISASFGIPDSLLYYTADSYIYNLNSGTINKRIEKKDQFIQIDNFGKWSVIEYSKRNYNKSVLTQDELTDIISKSLKIIKTLEVDENHTFSLMFLIDIPNYSQKSILWHFNKKKFNVKKINEISVNNDSIMVENKNDLEKLLCLQQPIIIRLKPKLEFIRNKDLILKLATIAKSKGHIIQIEGSVLSHIYYILQSEGVNVMVSKSNNSPAFHSFSIYSL